MKRILLALLTLVAASAVYAAEPVYMVVADGAGHETSLALDEIATVTFGAETLDMTVTLTGGATVAFTRADGWVVRFSANVTGIEALGGDNVPAPAAVYNLQGVMVKSVDDVNTLNIDNLPAGIYVIKSEKSTRKIIR